MCPSLAPVVPRYKRGMTEWSASKQAGFALAALLAGDRELEHVASAVSPAIVRETRLRLEGARSGDKARVVAHLLSFVRPPLTGFERALPPVLVAAIASLLPRAVARATLGAAPAVLSGFAPSPDLLPRLMRIARRSIAEEETLR